MHTKRNTPRPFAKLTTAAFALALAPSAFGLAPGDAISAEALAKAEFVKGEAPATWEPGKVYVLECWATWCAPCIAAIPHVDELYDKYHEKGLNVIGMNVFEDGKDKVAGFVKKKGDGMSYPVAYVGKGGAFEKDWLLAAGINGIPHAFLVKDGRLLFGIHPGSLSEKTIEALLAGGEAEAAELAKIKRATLGKDEIEELVTRFGQQLETKPEEAAAILAQIREIDENYPLLDHLATHAAIVMKEWGKAEILIKESRSPVAASNAAMNIGGLEEDVPVSLLEVIVKKLQIAVGGPTASPIDHSSLASLLWRLGRKEESLKAAEQATAGFRSMLGDRLPPAALNSYLESFKKGEPMKINDLFKLMKQPDQ